MRAGTFTVGDFALFVFYLGWVTDFPNGDAGWLTGYRQAGVSAARLLRPGAPAQGGPLAHPQPAPVYGGPLPPPPRGRDQRSRPSGERLETLDRNRPDLPLPGHGAGASGPST